MMNLPFKKKKKLEQAIGEVMFIVKGSFSYYQIVWGRLVILSILKKYQ
jgi:hypothetical protein